MSSINHNQSPVSSTSAIEALYFIGIGGIGMSAIARYFHTQGKQVSGYDKTSTVLTRQLEAEGIAIHYTEDIDQIPKQVQLVVYTPAVPASHKELLYYQQHNYNVVKRSDVLKIITENSFNICVAGTHGKTTVSTMIAHILRDSGFGCNAFLGGISANYQTNFWSHKNNVCVIEADEYDRSFLKLSPDIAVITAIDPDHLDIYGTAESFEQAFIDFSKKVKPDGLLVARYGINRVNELQANKVITYQLNNAAATVTATNIIAQNGSYVFDVVAGSHALQHVQLNMGGLHNIENVLAAITVALQLNIPVEKIKKAVANFAGVKRRFEYVLKNDNHVLIDDYAHHPEELKALINGVRSLFNNKLTMVFQPHLFSRTSDQADGFAHVLDMADEVVLLPIYPARELPVQGVNSEMLLNKMRLNNKQVLTKEALLQWVKQSRPQLLVMAGAGDIDTLLQPVKEILESQ